MDVRYVQGSVETIDSASALVSFVGPEGKLETLDYDRLVLAAGSRGFPPQHSGLAEHAFGVELMEEAIKLDHHLHGLAKQPSSKRAQHRRRRRRRLHRDRDRDEMPGRLRAILGRDADIRVVIVERNNVMRRRLRQPAAGDCEGHTRMPAWK